MNIYIPHYWMLDQLETEANPQTIASSLSLCGPSVERIDTIEGEPVYDIEVTTNRVDMMSVKGIAREAAAILPEFGIKATLKPDKDTSIKHINVPQLDIEIVNDAGLNHRILAIKISNVALGPSPQWLQQRLLQVGQRPLNNIVDITNFVMWEIGHPIHAFDYDRLTSKKIIVRTANPGESFTTLDNKTYTTVGGEVVYDDGAGNIIDLPGIMGTANTVVTNDTKNVLLWVEANDAQKIRFASMTHAIRTQAAVLNEKNVDPTLGLTAITRAAQLCQELAHGTLASAFYDDYPELLATKPVQLEKSKLETYLGFAIENERVIRILSSLGFDTSFDASALTYSVLPPSYRAQDVTIAQDVIEEIARIYGYHNLASEIMPTPIPDQPDHNNFLLEYQIKTWLSGWGAQEVYSYSMVSRELAIQSGFDLTDHITIKNPLSDDYVHLRRSLLPSLADVLRRNPHNPLGIFELQNIYTPQPGKRDSSELPEESLILALIVPNSYPKLKGFIEALLEKLHIDAEFIPESSLQGGCFDPNTGALIRAVDGQALGKIGKLSPGLVANAYGAELDYAALANLHHLYPHVLKIASNPPIIEDLTFTLPPNSYIGLVSATIHKTSSLIEAVTIKSTYFQNVTFTITYRSQSENLSNEMIEPLRREVIQAVLQKHAGKLVGEV